MPNTTANKVTLKPLHGVGLHRGSTSIPHRGTRMLWLLSMHTTKAMRRQGDKETVIQEIEKTWILGDKETQMQGYKESRRRKEV